MPINLRQDGDGSMGLTGTAGGAGEFVNIKIEYTAATVDKLAFVASRPYIVKSIFARPSTAGTDAGAVSVVVKKAASGTAITAGVALHAVALDLKGAADVNQTPTVTAADALIPAGTAIGLDFTGVLTAAAGVVTVSMVPV